MELLLKNLKTVADQISAVLVRAGSQSNVCERTIQMLDYERLADLIPSQASHGDWNDQPTI